MPKRRMQDSQGNYLDADDNPIGLTGAFAPVKGPQSVDYDKNDDPLGMTAAFAPIPADDEPRSWDEAGKWKDFDWDAAFGEASDAPAAVDEEPEEPADEPEKAPAADEAPEKAPEKASGPAHATEKTPADEEPAPAPAAAEPEKVEKSAPAAVPAAKPASSGSKGPKHGRHAAPEPEISPRMKKSKRTRKVLIVLLILLVLVLGGLGYFVFRTYSSSQQEAAQQTQEQAASPKEEISATAEDDAVEHTARLADVPKLTSLMGLSQDEAIAAIGHGALVTSNREVNEEGNPIKVNLNVALTDEAADSKTGTPTVYLGLGEDGKVRQVGYSASASALGFGSLSFSDAVNNEHVIEKTFAKAGITIPDGSAVLPANKSEYSTYASDGTTVVRERCSFGGDTTVDDVPCEWSAVLSYDYTTQVVTGNLADTVRVIYVYVTMK